jgi:hypothetical protein
MSKTLVAAAANSAHVDALVAAESQNVMRLLCAAVPLSLLVDLVLPTPSAEILALEGGDARWFTDVA